MREFFVFSCQTETSDRSSEVVRAVRDDFIQIGTTLHERRLTALFFLLKSGRARALNRAGRLNAKARSSINLRQFNCWVRSLSWVGKREGLKRERGEVIGWSEQGGGEW